MKITVLMSVYNGELYVRDAIKSILGQTYHDFEFLIIDDGSTDKTLDALKEFGDPRIRIIRHEQNKGLSPSLKEGVEEARGEYIARIDADDIAFDTRLSQQVRLLESDPRLGMTGSWFEVENVLSGKITRCCRRSNGVLLKWNLLFGNVFGHSTVTMRKQACVSAGNYDPTLDTAQDYDLWSRIARQWDVAMVPRVLGRIRLHASSISSNKSLLQEQRAEHIARGNVTGVVDKQLEPIEIERLVRLMRSAVIPEFQGDRSRLLHNLNVLVKCFAKNTTEPGQIRSIKCDCSVRLLNSQSRSLSLWFKKRCYLFALHVSVVGTLSGLFVKTVRKVRASYEDPALLLSNT